MSINEKMALMLQEKSDIRQSIVNKGVGMTGVDFLGFSEKVDEIEIHNNELIAEYLYACGNKDISEKTTLNITIPKGTYTIKANATLYSFTNNDTFSLKFLLNGTSILSLSNSDSINSAYGNHMRHKEYTFTITEDSTLVAKVSGNGDSHFYGVWNYTVVRTK